MPCNNRNNLTLDWSAHRLLLFSVYQTEIPCSDFYEIRLLKTWISAIKISPRRKIINYSLTLCRPQFDARQLLSTHLCCVFFYLLLTIYGKWGPSPSAQAAVFRPNAWKSFFWVVRRPSPFSGWFYLNHHHLDHHNHKSRRAPLLSTLTIDTIIVTTTTTWFVQPVKETCKIQGLFTDSFQVFSKLAFFDALLNTLLAKPFNLVIYNFFILSSGWSSLTLCCTTFRNNTTLQNDSRDGLKKGHKPVRHRVFW